MNRTHVTVAIISTALLALPFAAAAQSENQPAPSGYCPQLSQTLTRGMRDATTVPQGQVTELQKFLVDYYDLNPDDYITGYFGRLTQNNVIRFQREQNLPAYGVVGPMTRAAIARVCTGDTIHEPPPVSFSASPTAGSAPLTVHFFAKNLVLGQSYIVNFGDGNNATQSAVDCEETTCNQVPFIVTSHTYATAGTYTAQLFTHNGGPSGPLQLMGTATITATTSTTCTPDPSSPQTQTLLCPAGQTGSITQSRSSTCANGASSPTWGAWATTANTCQAAASVYQQNGVRIAGSLIPAYKTIDGLVAYQLNTGVLSAYKADGSLLWQKTTSSDSFSGGFDLNGDSYPDLIVSGTTGASCTDTSYDEIRDGKTGALLTTISPIANSCPSTVSYSVRRLFVGSVLFGSGSSFAIVPQYWSQGWFEQYANGAIKLVGAFYYPSDPSFGTYTAAQTSCSGKIEVPNSMPPNGLLVSGAETPDFVFFSSCRVSDMHVQALSPAQLVHDAPFVPGNNPANAGRNYGLVESVGGKVILIAGTYSATLADDARANAKVTDVWGGITRHFAIYDPNTGAVSDRYYSYAHDNNDASQYINRVTYPAHAVYKNNDTPLIFFNVFDGTNWYISVNSLDGTEIARISNTYVWDIITRTDGSQRLLLSTTSGYFPAEKKTVVATYLNGVATPDATLQGLPLFSAAFRQPDTSDSSGYLFPALITSSGLEVQ
jgi:PKD repeat protein